MAKYEIPEIDEAGELLEEIEAAEKARRVAERKMALAAEVHKVAKKEYDAACQECFSVTGRRLDMPLLHQKKDEQEGEGVT